MIGSIRLFRLTDNAIHMSRRCASDSALRTARQLLGLDPHVHVTAKALRKAYLQAALKCHPDLQKGKGGADFSKINDAYAFLQSGVILDEDLDITEDEEYVFRKACQEWLGLPPETVEESKRCPMFREWLMGGTESAGRWRVFFAHFGGLAPMLRPPAALLEHKKGHYHAVETRRKKS